VLPRIGFEVGRNKIEIVSDLGLICKYFMSIRPQVASTRSVFRLNCQYRYQFSISSLQGVRMR